MYSIDSHEVCEMIVGFEICKAARCVPRNVPQITEEVFFGGILWLSATFSVRMIHLSPCVRSGIPSSDVE